jgi:hypothetical protein
MVFTLVASKQEKCGAGWAPGSVKGKGTPSFGGSATLTGGAEEILRTNHSLPSPNWTAPQWAQGEDIQPSPELPEDRDTCAW